MMIIAVLQLLLFNSTNSGLHDLVNSLILEVHRILNHDVQYNYLFSEIN